jgi:hypothetical protein
VSGFQGASAPQPSTAVTVRDLDPSGSSLQSLIFMACCGRVDGLAFAGAGFAGPTPIAASARRCDLRSLASKSGSESFAKAFHRSLAFRSVLPGSGRTFAPESGHLVGAQ